MRFLYLFLALVLASACSSSLYPARSETKVYDLGKMGLTEKDSSTENLIMPYRLKLNEEMDEVIGISETTMEKGLPEGVLGNFSADACLAITKQYCSDNGLPQIDMCFLNNGGLRNSLPKGNITVRRVFELMPFENELVILELSPEKMRALLDFIANKGGMPIAGARIIIADEKAESILINGKEFDSTRNHFVVTSDYLANGGDHLGFLVNPVSTTIMGIKVRDGIISYIKKQKSEGKNLNPKIDGRISYARP